MSSWSGWSATCKPHLSTNVFASVGDRRVFSGSPASAATRQDGGAEVSAELIEVRRRGAVGQNDLGPRYGQRDVPQHRLDGMNFQVGGDTEPGEHCRLRPVEASGVQAVSHGFRLEIDRSEYMMVADWQFERRDPFPLPRLRGRVVDLEDPQPVENIGAWLSCSALQPSSVRCLLDASTPSCARPGSHKGVDGPAPTSHTVAVAIGLEQRQSRSRFRPTGRSLSYGAPAGGCPRGRRRATRAAWFGEGNETMTANGQQPDRCRRRGDHRCRVLRVVHAAQAAQRDGADGTRVRGRRRRRRDVVLEPLPGGAQRLGQLHLRLHLRRGAVAGVAVERALSRAARDPRLPGARRRALRPDVATSRSTPASSRRRSTRRRTSWTVVDRHRRDRHRPLRDHRGRCPVGVTHPAVPGHRHVPRRRATTPAGGRTRRSTSPASGWA